MRMVDRISALDSRSRAQRCATTVMIVCCYVVWFEFRLFIRERGGEGQGGGREWTDWYLVGESDLSSSIISY